MEVLEHGGPDEPRRPSAPGMTRRAKRVAAGVAAAGAAVLLASELRLLPVAAPASPQPPAGSPSPTGPSTPPPTPVPSDEALVVAGATGLQVATRSRALRRLDPSAQPRAGVLGDAVLVGSGALLAVVTPETEGAPAAVTLVEELAGRTLVVPLAATIAVAAHDGASFWIQSSGPDRPQVRRVDRSGSRSRTIPIDAGRRLVGATSSGPVVGGSDPARPGAVSIVAADGWRARSITPRGVVLDTSASAVAWASCPRLCAPMLFDQRRGQASARLDVGKFAELVSLRLAPDGRHFAAVLRRFGRQRYEVVVGHVPPGGRPTSTPLAGVPSGPDGRVPRLAYAPSGWLVVSNGESVHVVGPGPHTAARLSIALPPHDAIAVVRAPAPEASPLPRA